MNRLLREVQAAINIGFGVLLVAVGLRPLLRPPKPKAPTTDPKPPSIARSFLADAGAMATNLTTFALYTPALALIAGSGLPLRQQGIAALTILLITLMVAWVPLLPAAAVPGASTRLLPRLGSWMCTDNRWIQVVRGFGFGIWLLIKEPERPLGSQHQRSGGRHSRLFRAIARRQRVELSQ